MQDLTHKLGTALLPVTAELAAVAIAIIAELLKA
jgi:hypothetical protein